MLDDVLEVNVRQTLYISLKCMDFTRKSGQNACIITKISSNIGSFRMLPRAQLCMPSILRPVMSLLDMSNDFSAAALADFENK